MQGMSETYVSIFFVFFLINANFIAGCASWNGKMIRVSGLARRRPIGMKKFEYRWLMAARNGGS
jgi:hypothetical protein